MAAPLPPEAIVTLKVLKEQGQSNRQIARTLQVSEAAIRYHLRRDGSKDGRQGKPRKADPLAGAIDAFLARADGHPDGRPEAGAARPGNVLALFEFLQRE